MYQTLALIGASQALGLPCCLPGTLILILKNKQHTFLCFKTSHLNLINPNFASYGLILKFSYAAPIKTTAVPREAREGQAHQAASPTANYNREKPVFRVILLIPYL